ncbi:hypothetical protein IDJ75_15595 [Mucilaginibacter rigui]|uniref:Uncharacterized protein n=1 Tax=Mucilaginibacter rigui TaxID=534635 RepID=A0ABR7X7Z6_9SPHI|nr:hypothetical protein [Mucilaginibacter rigui]MBD1386706.1 hypothetical protein [Mucilaginibacter rigui]
MKRLSFFIISGLIVLSSCEHPTNPDQLINNKASLPASFKLSDLHQKVITSFINNRDSTMSILYGNKQAGIIAGKDVRSGVPGASFTLVTWHQQNDPHWFGARIPGELIYVETLHTDTAEDKIIDYQKYSGKNLVKLADTAGRSSRIHFILSQNPSIIP